MFCVVHVYCMSSRIVIIEGTQTPGPRDTPYIKGGRVICVAVFDAALSLSLSNPTTAHIYSSTTPHMGRDSDPIGCSFATFLSFIYLWMRSQIVQKQVLF